MSSIKTTSDIFKINASPENGEKVELPAALTPGAGTGTGIIRLEK